MLFTTTDTVEGYLITEYVTVVTAGRTFLAGGLIGEGYARMDKEIGNLYADALNGMGATVKNRANAIIGIKSSICGPVGGMVVMHVSGTAVKIERIVDPLPKTEGDLKREEEAHQAEEQRLQEEQRQEERQRKLEEYRKHTESGEIAPIDLQAVFEELEKLETTKDMMERVEEVDAMAPGLIPEEIMKQLRSDVEYSRICGMKSGARSFLQHFRVFVHRTLSTGE